MMQDLPLEPQYPASRLPYDDYLPLIPPLPPPPRSHRWKLAVLVGGIVLVLAASTSAAYLLGMQQGRETRSPTAATTPSAANGLASPDRTIFAQALAEALERHDATSIAASVETAKFRIACYQNVLPPQPGSCDTSWAEVQAQINANTLWLRMLVYGVELQDTSTLPSYCTGLTDASIDFLMIGNFQQETGMPLASVGLAVLGIRGVSAGSMTTWVWSAVYFC